MNPRITCEGVDMGAYENPLTTCLQGEGGAGQTEGMTQGGGEDDLEGNGENPQDPGDDCYFDDGTDEELTARCAS